MTETQGIKDKLTGRFWDVRDPDKSELLSVVEYKRQEELLNERMWITPIGIIPIEDFSFSTTTNIILNLIQGKYKIPFKDEWLTILEERMEELVIIEVSKQIKTE